IYTEFSWADEDIAERALYADLVLIGPQAALDEELRRTVIDGALFRSPTPMLINPKKTNVGQPAGNRSTDVPRAKPR
ncbi:hypothetical protein ACC730_38675, partial [Rhizobium ruizarguesonis]